MAWIEALRSFSDFMENMKSAMAEDPALKEQVEAMAEAAAKDIKSLAD